MFVGSDLSSLLIFVFFLQLAFVCRDVFSDFMLLLKATRGVAAMLAYLKAPKRDRMWNVYFRFKKCVAGRYFKRRLYEPTCYTIDHQIAGADSAVGFFWDISNALELAA